MQTVCVQRLFGMPTISAMVEEEHLGARAEALRAHSAMNQAEARLGRHIFWYGLAVSGLLLSGAFLLTL